MSQFNFYLDSSLTSLAAISLVQLADVSPDPVDGIVYLGSPSSDWQLQMSTDPGVDPIEVYPNDADPLSGPSATIIKLALSNGGLDSAVAGEPLELPHTIAGGIGNAVAIHYRISPPLLAKGSYTDLRLSIFDAIEFPA